MTKLGERIASLSPERRRLLEQRLHKARAHDRAERPDRGRDEPGREVRLPLSFAQQRLWFLHRLQPDSAFYNIPAALRLGYLRASALSAALGALVERHDALRTTFALEGDEPRQVIAPARPSRPVDLDVVDLRAAADPGAEARRLTAVEATHLFDLERGPLFRARLLRIGAQEFHLLLTFHHIVVDGWSLSILLEELGALYQAFSLGEPSPLGAPPRSYADFTRWQRQHLRGETLDALLAWWKDQLRDAPATDFLPRDRQPPPDQRFRGATLGFTIPRGVAAGLRALAHEDSATLFMVLLTLFQLLLLRYADQEDIVVGTPIANRTRAEFERTIGFFTNTLVIRANLSGNPTFRQALARVRDVTLGCYAHQDLPFERLVEELRPDRSQSFNPLFQVMFGLHEAHGAPRADGRADEPSGPPGTAKFDLTLFLLDRGDDLAGSIEYSAGVFDEATIARVARVYTMLAAAVARDPEQHIRHIPILSDGDQRQLRAWQSGPHRPRDARCLHDVVHEHAARNPGALAVRDAERSVTYGELARQVRGLGRRLRERGVGGGTIVGSCVPRGCDAVLAFLAVLEAGGIYLPLDPDYPPERLAYIAKDAGLAVLLAGGDSVRALGDSVRALGDPSLLARVSVLRIGPAEQGEQGDHGDDGSAPRAHRPRPDDAAYCIYTSGSTGHPKGAVIPHAGLRNVADAAVEVFGLSPEDRVLQFTTLAFDASILEIVMALRAGASLHVMPSAARTPGPEFVQYIDEHRISAAVLPPSLVAELRPDDLPRLRTLIVGGEACPGKLAVAWSRGRRFFNAYGPTEASIWASVDVGAPDDGSAPALPCIGRPIPNVTLHVLDSALQPVPLGAIGELCIGGAGVGRGYHRRPALTAERFVADPFAREPGGRLYRSGDLVRCQPDGRLQFLGRRDHQVKLSGFRIELREIEAVLDRHPDVVTSVVRLRRSRAGDGRLIAWIIPAPAASSSVVSAAPAPATAVDGEALREHLQQFLPDYMVPSAFVPVSAIPRTLNGKVRDDALPDPAPDPAARAAGGAPSTATEEAIAAIWRSLLDRVAIGRRDDFFAIGGHSLLATRVVSRLRDRFGVELTLTRFFQAPTIAALAEAIDVAGPAAPSSAAEIPRAPRELRRMTRAVSRDARTSEPSRQPSGQPSDNKDRTVSTTTHEDSAVPENSKVTWHNSVDAAYDQLMRDLRASYQRVEDGCIAARRAFEQDSARGWQGEEAQQEALKRYWDTLAQAGDEARTLIDRAFRGYVAAVKEALGSGDPASFDLASVAALGQNLYAASAWSQWMLALPPHRPQTA